jgi:hypothetical protein
MFEYPWRDLINIEMSTSWNTFTDVNKLAKLTPRNPEVKLELATTNPNGGPRNRTLNTVFPPSCPHSALVQPPIKPQYLLLSSICLFEPSTIFRSEIQDGVHRYLTR